MHSKTKQKTNGAASHEVLCCNHSHSQHFWQHLKLRVTLTASTERGTHSPQAGCETAEMPCEDISVCNGVATGCHARWSPAAAVDPSVRVGHCTLPADSHVDYTPCTATSFNKHFIHILRYSGTPLWRTIKKNQWWSSLTGDLWWGVCHQSETECECECEWVSEWGVSVSEQACMPACVCVCMYTHTLIMCMCLRICACVYVCENVHWTEKFMHLHVMNWSDAFHYILTLANVQHKHNLKSKFFCAFGTH